MKSFHKFVNITEADVKQQTKVNVIAPEILPVQPEGQTSAPTKSKKTKGVDQVKVSADIKARAAAKKKAEAIKKGYVSPEGRVQERGVITNRIRAAALGYGDKGKDPTKYGINPAEVSKNKTTLFQRALSSSRPERRSARREIKKAVRSIETRYPGSTERTATSFRGFSRGVGYTPSKSDISTLQRMARPETTSQAAARLSSQLGTGSGKRAQAASDAARDIASEPQRQAQQAIKRASKKATGFANLQQAIDSDIKAPKPKPLTKAQVAPKKITVEPIKQPVVTPAPKVAKPQNVDLVLNRPKFTSPKSSPLNVSTIAKQPIASSEKLADTVIKASKQVRADIAAEKAAERAKMMKGLGTAGKALSLLGAGIEAKKGYDIAKAIGGSQKRSIGAGAARAVGSVAGGVIGGTLGSIAGPIGSAAGAYGGLTTGAELGSKIYDVVTGDPKKKVTTQGVLTNIRKAVPQEIRAKVPANLRKGFTDFVKTAGRSYGNWQRSQEGKK